MTLTPHLMKALAAHHQDIINESIRLKRFMSVRGYKIRIVGLHSSV